MKRLACFLLVILLCGAVWVHADFLNIPPWTREDPDFAYALSEGIVPDLLDGTDLADDITRLEFCAMAVRVYERVTGTVQAPSYGVFFTDTDDPWVDIACIRGIVSGYPDGTFRPDASITRQEMFQMLYNLLNALGAAPVPGDGEAADLLSPFPDAGDVGAWAVPATAAAIARGITAGNWIDGAVLLDPLGHTTRAQAIVMAARFLQGDLTPVSAEPEPEEPALPEGVLEPGTPLTTWGRYADTDAKMTYIFGSPDGPKYSSYEEALGHMAEIEVPVWHLNGDGTKTASTMTLQVHEKLAATVLQIFREIFASPEQFPIKEMGGFGWRGDNSKSEHNWGLAIDINWNENYYVTVDGTPLSGSYWRPGEDPYSIPADSDVVAIFHKYGFGWGGDGWWTNTRDYMHFSFMST